MSRNRSLILPACWEDGYKRSLTSLFFLFFLELFGIYATLAHSRDTGASELMDLSIEQLAQVKVLSIASGRPQTVVRAPAIATVISAEDIKAMGATSLEEALEAVAGLHVSTNSRPYTPIYTIRGIHTPDNPQVLVLINGIPSVSVTFGVRDVTFHTIPVSVIERIEVIRGPGSAVYGADAVSGVINVITKTGDDIDGNEVGVRAGSFDTQDGWLQHGGRYGDLEFGLMLDYRHSDGHGRTIAADAQTVLDGIFGTNASLAPGPVDLRHDNAELRADLGYRNWRLRGSYQHRDDAGTGPGLLQALQPDGRIDAERWSLDLSYNDRDFRPHWELSALLSYAERYDDFTAIQYPPGATFGAGVFEDGLRQFFSYSERHMIAEASAFYTGFENHTLRFGVGYRSADLHEVIDRDNAIRDVPVPVPSPVTIDYSDTPLAVAAERKRSNRYVFFQDAWQFADDWELTAGVRYDNYSDFGPTFNPRLALVWDVNRQWTAKALYGRAFRAPTFFEQGGGDPGGRRTRPADADAFDLDPETMETAELGLYFNASDALQLSASVFGYSWSDIIRFQTNANGGTTLTIGEQRGYGLELEGRWRINNDWLITGNYAYQRSTDETSGGPAGNAPNHQVYVRSDWQFAPDWSAHAQLNWIGDRRRVEGDQREDLDGYSSVDLALRYQSDDQPWELALALRNAFDSDVREPYVVDSSAAEAGLVLLPDDLPQAGRNAYLELRLRF